MLHVLPITYRSAWAAVGAFGWLVINAALVWLAIRRVRSLRFAGERRAGVRFAVDVPGSVDGTSAGVQDVSVGGALLATREPLVTRERHLVSFELAAGIVSLWASVRSMRRAASGELHYAFEFDADQDVAAADLTRAIFQGEYPVAGVEPVSMPEVLRTDLVELSRRARRRGLVRPAAPRGARPVLRSGGA